MATAVDREAVDWIGAALASRGWLGLHAGDQVSRFASDIAQIVSRKSLTLYCTLAAPLLRVGLTKMGVGRERGAGAAERIGQVDGEGGSGRNGNGERVLPLSGKQIGSTGFVPHIVGIEVGLFRDGSGNARQENAVSHAENKFIVTGDGTIGETDARSKGEVVLIVDRRVRTDLDEAGWRGAAAVVNYGEAGVGSAGGWGLERGYEVWIEATDASVFIGLVAIELIAYTQVQGEAAVDAEIVLKAKAL